MIGMSNGGPSSGFEGFDEVLEEEKGGFSGFDREVLLHLRALLAAEGRIGEDEIVLVSGLDVLKILCK